MSNTRKRKSYLNLVKKFVFDPELELDSDPELPEKQWWASIILSDDFGLSLRSGILEQDNFVQEPLHFYAL